jgi:O-antigen ligase
MTKFLHRINNSCLYLLVFSATFEYWDPFKLSQVFSVAKMATIVYFISAVPFFRNHLNFNSLKRFFYPLVLYILAGIVSTSFNDQYVINIGDIFNLRIIQLIFLMFLIAGHVSSDKRILDTTLDAYVLSLFLMGLLNFFGIGDQFVHGRLYIFGENPNLTGMKTSLAFLIVTAKLIRNGFSIKRMIYSIILVIPILNLLILSGSRGGLLSLVAGVFVMMLLLKISWIKKVFLFLMGFVFSIYLFSYILLNDPTFGKRIESSIQKGETAGRGHLWESAYRILEDNFFLGVGASGLLPVMQKYSGRAIEPHNLFLEVWLTSGFLGFVFFLVFLLRLSKSLYIDYRTTKNVLFLIIFVVIIFNMSKSGGSIGFIFAWIFFALLIGSILINKNMNLKNLYK